MSDDTGSDDTGSDGAKSSAAAELKKTFDIQPVLVPFLAIVLAVFIGGILIAAIGDNPFEAYWALLRGMWGSPDRIASSLARSAPFIGASLAVAFAFRAGLFNIGAEGQLLIGATATAWVGTWAMFGDTPGIILVPLLLVAGTVGGLIWGGIPGVLKARTGAHEVIVTIMLNNIAALYVRYLVSSQDPIILRDEGASVPRTASVPSGARLPKIVDIEPPLHSGIIIMIVLCFVVAFLVNKTPFGFEIRTVGTNPDAAKYAGMGVNRTIILVMALSGAFAGLAGSTEILGTSGFLSPGVFVAIGFDSIAIALLARANPYGIIPAAILWGSMLSGAGLMQQETGLSVDAVRIVQALVLLFVAADVIVRTVFRIKRGKLGAFETTNITSGWGGGT
ncbi:MAG TPA: ABC transporter permease [Acidimicrobiales bacterium]|nr:ABC transporter permease [Acidimicrobiales bacterium]